MPNPFIDVHSDFSVFRNGIRNLIVAIQNISKEELEPAANEIAVGMRVPGSPITYPVDWDSIKQKIYVIIKLREERNLPYKRTDEYIGAWQVVEIERGYRTMNASPGALYLSGGINGLYQSNIHKGRWPLFRSVFLPVVLRLRKRVTDSLRKAIKRTS